MSRHLNKDEIACDMAAFGLVGDLTTMERLVDTAPQFVIDNMPFIEEAYQRLAHLLVKIENIRAQQSPSPYCALQNHH